MESLLVVLSLASSIALIVSVVMQDGAEQNMGAISGSAAPIWGQAKGQSKNDVLKRITIVAAVVFMLAHLALAAIK